MHTTAARTYVHLAPEWFCSKQQPQAGTYVGEISTAGSQGRSYAARPQLPAARSSHEFMGMGKGGYSPERTPIMLFIMLVDQIIKGTREDLARPSAWRLGNALLALTLTQA